MLLTFLPGLRCNFRDLVIGHVGEASQDVAKVGGRIKAPPPAAFNDRVDDCAAFPGFRFPHKQPVLLADGRRANGVFYAETPIMPRTRRGG